jgi:hypothetical protein
MHRLRCQILMPTCTPGSGLRPRREPPSVGRGCHGALLRYQSVSEELAIRIKRIRAAIGSRLALVYGPELSTLSEAERAQLLVAFGYSHRFLRAGDGCARITACQSKRLAIYGSMPSRACCQLGSKSKAPEISVTDIISRKPFACKLGLDGRSEPIDSMAPTDAASG